MGAVIQLSKISKDQVKESSKEEGYDFAEQMKKNLEREQQRRNERAKDNEKVKRSYKLIKD